MAIRPWYPQTANSPVAGDQLADDLLRARLPHADGIRDGVVPVEQTPEVSHRCFRLLVSPMVARDLIKQKPWDCMLACSFWRRRLVEAGIPFIDAGGEGVDGDQEHLVHLSGYREAGGEVIRRHYWLGVGDCLLLFDPTAHQWSSKGGLKLEWYVQDGLPFDQWRRLQFDPSSS